MLKGTYLEGVRGDENDAENVEDDPVVYRAHTTSEGREGEEFLGAPDLVDSVDVLHLLLLDSLLVELGRDLVSVNVTEELHVVEQCQEVGSAHDAFDGPVVDLTVLMAVDELNGVSLGKELARGWPGDVHEQWHKHDLHKPEVEPVDVAAVRVHEFEAVSERLLAGQAETNSHQEDVEEESACNYILQQSQILHETVEFVLVLNVETTREGREHDR